VAQLSEHYTKQTTKEYKNMKYSDDLLMIVAGYSLYTLILVFSTHYFAGINQLIPELFSDRAIINISNTFHQVLGSLVAGLLMVRFGSKPVLLAFVIAVVINLEGYFVVLTKSSAQATLDYYLANPTEILNLLKTILLLPSLTYLLGLIRRFQPDGD